MAEVESVPPAGGPAGGAPQLSINAQYIKDLSFESPNAPQSLTSGAQPPHVAINVDVQARGIAEAMFEVVLRITANATQAQQSSFVAELVYGGVFTLRNIPQEHMEAICLVECPRLLFPFARQIIANVTRDGGFAPLMLDPIDFLGLFQRSRQQGQAQAGANGNGGSSSTAS